MSAYIVGFATFENVQIASYAHEFDLGIGGNGTLNAIGAQSTGTEVTQNQEASIYALVAVLIYNKVSLGTGRSKRTNVIVFVVLLGRLAVQLGSWNNGWGWQGPFQSSRGCIEIDCWSSTPSANSCFLLSSGHGGEREKGGGGPDCYLINCDRMDFLFGQPIPQSCWTSSLRAALTAGLDLQATQTSLFFPFNILLFFFDQNLLRIT